MGPTSLMLHEELAQLYRGKSTDITLQNQYWVKILELEQEEGVFA